MYYLYVKTIKKTWFDLYLAPSPIILATPLDTDVQQNGMNRFIVLKLPMPMKVGGKDIVIGIKFHIKSSLIYLTSCI